MSAAEVEWGSDWVAAIDSLIQLEMIQKPVRCLQRPSRLQKLMLDPSQAPHDSGRYLPSRTGERWGLEVKYLEGSSDQQP